MRKNSFDIEKSVYFRFTSICCIILFILLAFWGNLFYQWCTSPTDNLNHLKLIFAILIIITPVLILNIIPAGGIAAIITDCVLKKQIQLLFKINSNLVIRVLQYTFFIFFHVIFVFSLSINLLIPFLLMQFIPFTIIYSAVGIIITLKIYKLRNSVNNYNYNNESLQVIIEAPDNRGLIVTAAIIINFLIFHYLTVGIVHFSEFINSNPFKNAKITSKNKVYIYRKSNTRLKQFNQHTK